ncbi:MAG TPA: sigma 54-interacting transcriptional regulator [Polyangiaceae bacterium]|nr:sigma 54-interacting transcriptional regulator [Polyangiaceae bacterium]
MKQADKGETASTLSNEPAPDPRAPERQEPFLFVILSADRPLAQSSRHALGRVDEVLLRRGARRADARVVDGDRKQLVIMIPDPRMSSEHARIRRSERGWIVEDAGSKNGTLLDGERLTQARLRDGAILEVGRTFLLFRSSLPFRAGDAADRSAPSPDDPIALLATLSPALERAFDVLRDVAASTIPVHISGESGTGKEVLARAIHALSGREGTFVAVNCGGLPATLVEAELFGYRKGAFSGAHDERAGLVRTAHGGTLFLDEIGDLPHAAQAAILRMLQEREVLPLGSDRPVAVNLRIVSATHRDLEASVRASQFRADLLARLAGYRLKLPPLRERREDLGLLVARLLERIEDVSTASVSFSAAAARALVSHAWPRNVRELEHRIRLGVVLAKGGVVEVDHIFGPDAEPFMVLERDEARATGTSSAHPARATAEAQRAAVEAMLEQHQGNISAVARAMGKARVQVQRWIKRYGLDPAKYRTGA